MITGLFLALALAGAQPSAADAVLLQHRGDAVGALRLAETILRRSEDPIAGLVATCAAIEAGDLRRADALLRPIERRTNTPPRAAVLRQLISRRARSSGGSLMDDLALAWRDAGRPDLSAADPELDAWRHAPSSLPASVVLSPGDRLLLAPPQDKEEQRQLALAAAATAQRNAFVVNLKALGLLGMLDCPKDLAQQRAAVAQLLTAAGNGARDNGYVVVVGWIATCPDALDMEGTALLADAAKRAQFGYPRTRAFDEILAVTKRLRDPNPRAHAISAWLALDSPLMRLVKLSDSIQDPALRGKAGMALQAIGRRMGEATAWLERLQGWSLAVHGAKLSGDGAVIARARSSVEAQRCEYREWADAKGKMGVWPFAAVWRDWAPDELEASRRLLRLLSEDAK